MKGLVVLDDAQPILKPIPHRQGAGRFREFVAWDGEGCTHPGDVTQSYVLFGNNKGDRVISRGLGTAELFNLLIRSEQKYPDAIHVGFSLQYDINMMLRDFGPRELWYIYRHGKISWRGYKIEYRPGKWFWLKKGSTSLRLFDVFGFFQSSFVAACEKFLGKDDPELDRIREGKQHRNDFAYEELDSYIIPYWEGELRLLVRVMESLRSDLLQAGLSISSWHGPGAVANKTLRKYGVQSARKEAPEGVQRAAQYAYAGGRFELFKCGHHPGRVYEYDINSAYPTAIAKLPNLSTGTWKYTDTFQPGSFGVWHIKYAPTGNFLSGLISPKPLFHRDKYGAVAYPAYTEGWYWTPEAECVPSHCIKGGWVLEHDNSQPFAFVEEMYEKRRKWKENGNSAERALKLALNSLYGKMAQRVGWDSDQKIPRWHQLEWAGYVTSATRAKLWNAALKTHPELIVAVETDALFTLEPLPHLEIGKGLGQWEVTEFDWITYIQNGLYYGAVNGEAIEKYRGFDKGSLSHDRVIHHLHNMDRLGAKCPPLSGITTRFIGLGLGLRTSAVWRSWQREPKEVLVGGGGKRCHNDQLCRSCQKDLPLAENLHELVIAHVGGWSYPHRLPWLADDEPELRQRDELARW